MWKREQTDVNAFSASIEVKERNDWEAWAFIASDIHIDNPDCRRDLFFADMDKAKARNAMIILPGDVFCMMQGKYDKRSSKNKVRPEHQTDTYLDTVIEDTAALLKPYQSNILVIGEGNHETSIKNRHEINPIERLCALLNMGAKEKVFNGHYGGYVRFKFNRGKCGSTSRLLNSTNLRYVHGWGGGGPITQDMIQESRRVMMYADADIIASGHTHDHWSAERMVERFTASGKITLQPLTSLKTGTYKDEYKTGKGGWHVETGKPPKPLGGTWIRFYFSHKLGKVEFDCFKAK